MDQTKLKKRKISITNDSYIEKEGAIITSPRGRRIEPRDKLLLQTFDFLRFPLMVSLIFVHNTMNVPDDPGFDHSVYDYIMYLFTWVFAKFRVPLFFLMSGFLFFYNAENLSYGDYVGKLRRRARSLLIPYMIWSALYISLYIIYQYLSSPNWAAVAEAFSPQSLFYAFVGKMQSDHLPAYPVAYQFWFVRDLICCSLIAPLIWMLVRRLGIIAAVIAGSAWFLNIYIPVIGHYGFSPSSLFFFTTGAFLSIGKTDIIKLLRCRPMIPAAYPLIKVAELATTDYAFNLYIHKLGIIFGIAFWLYFVSRLLEAGKIKGVPLLTSSAFFIFALHAPIMMPLVRESVILFIKVGDQTSMIAIYILSSLLTAISCLGIYILMQRFLPRLTAILTGRR